MRWDFRASGEAVVAKYRRAGGEKKKNPLTTEEDGGMREEPQSGNNGRKTHCRGERRDNNRNAPLRGGEI